jgi:hypothetical protein
MSNEDFTQLESQLRQAFRKEKMAGLTPDQLGSLYARTQKRQKKTWLTWAIPGVGLAAACLAVVIVIKAPEPAKYSDLSPQGDGIGSETGVEFETTATPAVSPKTGRGLPPAEPPAAKPAPAKPATQASTAASKKEIPKAKVPARAERSRLKQDDSTADAPKVQVPAESREAEAATPTQWQTKGEDSYGTALSGLAEKDSAAPALTNSAPAVGGSGAAPTGFAREAKRDAKQHVPPALNIQIIGKKRAELPLNFVAAVRACVTMQNPSPGTYDIKVGGRATDSFTACVLRSAEIHREKLGLSDETLRITISVD